MSNNPKHAQGQAKAPLSCVPMPAIYELGLALLEGALKYGRHNWRESEIDASDYFDALQGHVTAWWEGEDIDPDSGRPHLAKAFACLAILLDAGALGKLRDDRPPRHPDGWRARLSPAVQALRRRHPEPKPAHTQTGAPK